MRHRAFTALIAVIQFILLLAHYFLYQTWTFRHVLSHPGGFQAGLGVLSVSFVVASVLAFSLIHLPFGWPDVIGKAPLGILALIGVQFAGSVAAAIASIHAG